MAVAVLVMEAAGSEQMQDTIKSHLVLGRRGREAEKGPWLDDRTK